VRRLPHANAGSDLVPQFVTSRHVFLEFKAFVTSNASLKRWRVPHFKKYYRPKERNL
jgi:hypothetical protein